MANAFSICALSQSWKMRIPPGREPEVGINIKDPGWLVLQFSGNIFGAQG